MKKKLRIIEGICLSIVILFDIILVNISYDIGKYITNKDNRSTANYMKVDEIKKELQEETKESIEGQKEEKIEEQVEKKEEVVVKEEPKVEEKQIVYDGKTVDEIAEQLNKSLNSTIAGKGYLIASKSIEIGVDPYMATAIILHETGCKWNCSSLVKNCNNVGGQKGSGCGSYSYFESLDVGIEAFINNLYKNYIAQGLTTLEAINTKYAASQTWSVQVNNYIESIKAQ